MYSNKNNPIFPASAVFSSFLFSICFVHESRTSITTEAISLSQHIDSLWAKIYINNSFHAYPEGFDNRNGIRLPRLKYISLCSATRQHILIRNAILFNIA